MKDTNKITCNQRYRYQHVENMQKTPFRLAKPNVLFSKGNSNGYGGRIADQNDAIIDDAEKGCANGN